ncbi:pyridoxal phosphate-dependent aminotransferase [bacterium]
MELSNRISLISASPTLAIAAKAKLLMSQGEPVISFSAGEPDFDTPSFIKESAKQALDEGFTKYTPASGIPDLKKAICDKLKKDNNLDYKPSQIVVSNGAKHSLFNTFLALCNKGDEVILIAPYWVSYFEQIKFAEAVPKVCHTNASNNFRIDFDSLKSLITKKTKIIVLNSPSNPTGVVYTKDELKQIADIAAANNIYIISDEIYEKIIYNSRHISIAGFGEEIKKRTIVINGVSKSHAMTGWRIGYSASVEEIASAMNKLQSQSTSGPNSIAQKAALTALTSNNDWMYERVMEFKQRRGYVVSFLNSINDISCFNPSGAFYVFPDVSKYFGRKFNDKKIETSMDVCGLLLEHEKVAVVPGEAFGDGNYIRLSYALGIDNIKEGLARIKNFFSKCK